MKNKINRMEMAKRLGVSHMTVSRAFMENQSISQKTRKKILDACGKYGYSPSPLGRALRRGSTNSICAIVPNIHQDAFSRLIHGIQEKAMQHGYNITIFKPRTNGLLTLSEAMFIQNHKFDGIVIDSLCEPAVLKYLKSAKTPIVTVSERLNRESNTFYYIGTKDYESAREVAGYLISLGRKKLLHLAGTPGVNGKLRERGFIEKAREEGINDFLVVTSGWVFEDGYRETTKLIGENIGFNAIFACNDYVAAGALHALHEKGVKVPDEVSLIGFAGDMLGEALYPPLTTIFQPFEKMGERAAELLFEMIKKKKCIRGEEFFENRLLIRKSCSPFSNLNKQETNGLVRKYYLKT
ncbi:MAG: LacI family DNA-binding transcriptional regulator [Victivallales bacterium]